MCGHLQKLPHCTLKQACSSFSLFFYIYKLQLEDPKDQSLPSKWIGAASRSPIVSRRQDTGPVILIYFILKHAMEILLSESSIITTFYFRWATSSVAIFRFFAWGLQFFQLTSLSEATSATCLKTEKKKNFWRRSTIRNDVEEPKDLSVANVHRDGGNHGKGFELPLFHFAGIRIATGNFSDANKIGKGGFGPVYKGKLLGGEQVLAVKRLSERSNQGVEGSRMRFY